MEVNWGLKNTYNNQWGKNQQGFKLKIGWNQKQKYAIRHEGIFQKKMTKFTFVRHLKFVFNNV